MKLSSAPILHLLLVLTSQTALAIAITWNDASDARWAFNCGFNGNDIGSSKSTGEQCGGICSKRSDCTHFTWTNHNGGTCWLKGGAVNDSSVVQRNTDYNSVCGVVKRNSGSVGNGEASIQWKDSTGADADVRWAMACAFDKNDIGSQKSIGEQCALICMARADCTHFTWTSQNGGTCWMKGGGAGSESTAKAKNTDNAVCGFLKSRSGTDKGGDIGISSTDGVSRSGTTSRYWDCCKPSCSWPGKASVSAPIATCGATPENGVSKFGPNDSSGCDGGPAFMCNSQIPFDGPDGVAYGYAAAIVTGKSERDTCCACYELTFMSGSVKGKKMIIQVTHKGADSSRSNHFDIQIPGGGVGIFNGCSSQWGAPPDGWGSRYGGISSQTECDQLPWQIRDGCNWRFGWFKNAANPSINFREVACPKALTDRTDCVRT